MWTTEPVLNTHQQTESAYLEPNPMPDPPPFLDPKPVRAYTVEQPVRAPRRARTRPEANPLSLARPLIARPVLWGTGSIESR